MTTAQFLKTRVSPDTKRLVQIAAREQLLTESIWLRRVILRALSSDDRGAHQLTATRGGCEKRPRLGAKLSVRLPPEDQLLLRERAEARAMAPATYVSVLVRVHLRNLSPLPKDELLALKRSIAELGAIGRNINQLARAANQGDRTMPAREDLRAILKVCEGLRDHVKALVKANLATWETGHSETGG